MTLRSPVPLLLLLAGGCPRAETRACDRLCDTLVTTCGFAAYPDLLSCQQGCAYEASEGAELGAFDACIAAAECDEFAVIACARAHGVQ